MLREQVAAFAFAALMSGLIGSVGLHAHHSIAAEVDINQRVTINGIVTKFEWTNPHGRIYLDVKEPTGSIAKWEVSTGSVAWLRREGWTRDALRVGDALTVIGSPARDGRRFLSGATIMTSDGRKILSGTAPEEEARR